MSSRQSTVGIREARCLPPPSPLCGECQGGVSERAYVRPNGMEWKSPTLTLPTGWGGKRAAAAQDARLPSADCRQPDAGGPI